jgi:arsenite oxidase small subunit
MKRCDAMVDVGRRKFLTGASIAAGAAAASIGIPNAKAAPSSARVTYPSNRLANVADLKANEPLSVNYPDDDAPGVLLKLGTRVPTGAGPDGDIVVVSAATISAMRLSSRWISALSRARRRLLRRRNIASST